MPTATEATTGRNVAVVAVLLVSSVRKRIETVTRIRAELPRLAFQHVEQSRRHVVRMGVDGHLAGTFVGLMEGLRDEYIVG